MRRAAVHVHQAIALETEERDHGKSDRREKPRQAAGFLIRHLDQPGDNLDNAIRQNVVLTVAGVKAATPILSKAVEDNKIRVVGAVYDLADGRVTLVN